MIERAGRKVLFNLVGPGLPVWSVAWRPDGSELVTGGGDRLVRRWNAGNGEPIGRSPCPVRRMRWHPSTASAARRCFAPAWPVTA
jgi:WD40 repeat protein